MSGSRAGIAKRFVPGLMLAVAVGALAHAAEAAVGSVLRTVDLPAAAQCGEGTGGGTAVAVVQGSKAGVPQVPVVLVTSCVDAGQAKLFFIDPGNPPTTPPTVVKTINTTVTPARGWGALSLRHDKLDLLACGITSTEGLATALYAIDIDPFNTVPDGTATLLRTGPAGSTCDGVAWDLGDKTIFQSSTGTSIFHLGETAAAPQPTPSSILSGCTVGVTGLAVAGPSLFAGCLPTSSLTAVSPGTRVAALDLGGLLGPPNLEDLLLSKEIVLTAATGTSSEIRRLDKTNGALVQSFPGLAIDVGDLECDGASFGLSLKDVLWVKDQFFAQLFAVEIPNGVCGVTAGPIVVAPAACPPGTIDSNKDGLLDCWKDLARWGDGLPGIDFNGDGVRDLILCVDTFNGNHECADPRHKDIFVQIDYMLGRPPDPVAIGQVVQAFANAPVSNLDGTTGIRLHVQIGNQLPYSDNLAWVPCTGPAAPGDQDHEILKANFFGLPVERANPNALNAKRFSFHYGMWVNNLTGLGTTSGCAKVWGNDFVVSLGSWGAAHGTTTQQAAALFHEIGHNLNLRHGGSDNVNCKPNYESVMSYSRQFSGSPIATRPLDFSSQTQDTLVETALNKATGVGGFSGQIAFGPPVGFPKRPSVVSGSAAVDWNRNGSFTGVVSQDINNFGIAGCPASPGQTLEGFNDWANVQLNFRAGEFADGASSSIDASKAEGTLEITLEEALAMCNFDIVANACRSIDVEPHDPNNHQTVWGIFFSSKDGSFDATGINLATATLQGTTVQGAVHWVVPVKRNRAGMFLCRVQDVNRDGRPDLVCRFQLKRATVPVGVSRVSLNATTFAGEPVQGDDVITVIAEGGDGPDDEDEGHE